MAKVHGRLFQQVIAGKRTDKSRQIVQRPMLKPTER